MKTIHTKTGKTFDVLWCAPSTIDNVLRFAVANSDIDTVHNTFKLPSETESLVLNNDGKETTFTGYTDYRGFDKKIDGEIVVAINPV